MRKIWFGLLGVAVAVIALQFTQANVNAGLFSDCSPCNEVTACDPCEAVCNPCDPCGGKKGGWFVNGFIESGFWANEFGNKSWYPGWDTSRHNLAAWPGNTGALQNVRHTGYQVNQVYLSTGKIADGRRGWDFGGQVDFVFGSDAWMVQSAGLEKLNGHDDEGWGTGDYYSAFAQAYVQAAYKNLDIYAGKFYAPFGAQKFRGDENFFYSFAPNFDFLPVTASGAYATYAVNRQLTVLGGWVVPDMFGETSHNNALLGGVSFQANKKLNLTYNFAAGQIGEEDLGYDLDYFVNSLIATYNINKKWKTVIDWSLFNTKIDDFDYNYTAWGINAAVFYQYSKTLAFGARYNYVSGSKFANFDYGRYGINGFYGNWGTTVKDWTAISLGANWTPAKWLVVKPEIRWDIADTVWGGYFADKSGNPHKQQFSGGLSTVVKF
ncbi:MAG: porin [Planctomycetaceae bacterium]|nr:porin [Planctomycetaceae bacterium]